MLFLTKSQKIDIFKIQPMHSRIFHFTWIAFFLCFFGWFGVAPLMPYIRKDLQLTQEQIGNTIIASVFITIFARILIGWILDKIGPRKTYSLLLIFGAFPVMFIGIANNYETFLLFRLAIGIIGASFVITQFHTSLVFASNVVGTANATTAGWGNLGGGIVQFVMPTLILILLGLGFSESISWRISMILPGILLFIMGILYFIFTQDTLDGNYEELKRKNVKFLENQTNTFRNLSEVLQDKRVWILFLVYGGCFGIELTINNIAALYYVDVFSLSPTIAGFIASLFGLMNLFARSLGGIFGDKMGIRYGLKGRVLLLSLIMFLEGLSLILFSQIHLLFLSILALIIFSTFVQMAEGATFSVVPFVKRNAIGSVSGIVGAGGNVGAVLAGFLFRGKFDYQTALLILGTLVVFISIASIMIKFNEEDERLHSEEIEMLFNPQFETK